MNIVIFIMTTGYIRPLFHNQYQTIQSDLFLSWFEVT